MEISKPSEYSEGDDEIVETVDQALRENQPGLSVTTVAGTIFPIGLYTRLKRPAFYDSYIKIMKKAKKKGTWGTYALRMIDRESRKGKTKFNPLEKIIRKLQKAHNGTKYQAVYELGVIDAEWDIDQGDDGFGAELPLYEPAIDQNKSLNMPCLSHLSFKISGDKLDLTAIYRSHWYGQRALGNLVGLAQLHSFAAKESKFKQGTLTCIATHALLDEKSLGDGKAQTRKLLQGLPADYEQVRPLCANG